MVDTGLFVDSDRKLTALLASIAGEPALALDTEFVREKTYYPKLGLIQIANAGSPAILAATPPINVPQIPRI